MSRPIQNIPLEILAPMRLEFRPPSRARVTLSEECSARIPNGNIRANMNEATAGRYGRDERFSFFFLKKVATMSDGRNTVMKDR